jgi:hypothetical protein
MTKQLRRFFLTCPVSLVPSNHLIALFQRLNVDESTQAKSSGAIKLKHQTPNTQHRTPKSINHLNQPM